MVLTAASRARNTELRMQLYDDKLCIYRALNVPQLADRSLPITNTILLPINFSSVHNAVPAIYKHHTFVFENVVTARSMKQKEPHHYLHFPYLTGLQGPVEQQ